jgi:hypothetical protein
VFSRCPGDFDDLATDLPANVEVSHSVLTRNEASILGGGAIAAFGCSFAEPFMGQPVPRTTVRLSDSSFEGNRASGEESVGGAMSSAYGVSTVVFTSVFHDNSDSCSKEGTFYLNLFSSEGDGCTDTLTVLAELTPACDAWAALGLVHEEVGSQAAGTEDTCVPLKAMKDAAFCCAPSLSAPLSCPLTAALSTELTCPLPEPHEHHALVGAAPTVHTAVEVMAQMVARRGSAMD